MEKEKEKNIKTVKEKLKKGNRIDSSELEQLVKKEYNETLKE